MKKICLLPLTCFLFAAIVKAQNVNVNPGAGSYVTLKNAFDAINSGTHTGAITIDIIGNTTETSTAVLNASGAGAASYSSIIIFPSGGASRTISGNITGHLIDLNGADNVTIDGLNTGGNSLTISNTATGAASTVRYIADATNNTIQNCTLIGSTTSFGVVYFSTGTTTGNDGNNINHCNITASGSNLPRYCVYSTTTNAAIDNSGITINANNISDYYASSFSAGIRLIFYNSSWVITNNRLFQTATRIYTGSGGHYGIHINDGSGYTISGNIIGFANSSGTGTTNMVGNSVPLGGTFPAAYTVTGTPVAINYIGIVCASSATNIHGNTIAGFALYTSSNVYDGRGIWCGISVTGGNINIGTTSGNTIGATSGTGSIYAVCTSSGGSVVGIYATSTFSTNTITIQNNTIGAIDAMGTTASVSGGITGIRTGGTISNPNPGNYNISGNTIGNTTNPNLRMGNLTNGADLSNTGTTFSAASGTSTFEGIINWGTGAIVIGIPAMPNIIRNVYQNSTSSSSSAHGIACYEGSSLTISGNTVMEISSASSNIFNQVGAGIGAVQAIVGIYDYADPNGQTIDLNSISALRAVNTGAFDVNVTGLFIVDGEGNVRRNKIFDLTNTNTGTLPKIIGINLSSAPTWTVSNNMISITNGANPNPVHIAGMYDDGVSGVGYYYFNSINVGGSASGGAIGSSAFWRNRTHTSFHRNNIYSNTRTGGTSIHYTILCSSATPATGWSATASDNNVFNNASSSIGRWGTTDVDFSGWQSNSLGDYNSLSGIPLTFTNAATGDLHLNMGVTPTPIESGGVVVSGITNDYDADIRYGSGGYAGTGTAPDIGADEFEGVHLTVIYTFNGNGNWSDAANWVNMQKPPSAVGAGYQIFIDPVSGGQCVLDVLQSFSTGANITVRTGKTFFIP